MQWLLSCYILGIPAYFGFKLWALRNQLDDTNVLARYGFLYEMYRRDNYWWDVYEMLQKLFLTGIIVLIFPGKTLQVVIVVLADLGFLMNLLIQKPHKVGPTRNLAMMANMACTLTMYCGLVLVSVPETGEKYNLLFDAVLVLMNGCVAVYAAIHIAPFRLLATIITGMRKRADKDKRALKRRKTMSLLPSSERDRAHQIVRSLSMKNMNIAQVVPKSGSMRRLPVRGVANTRANDDFLSSSSDEDLIHQEEDHHNTVINGKKGPHEL